VKEHISFKTFITKTIVSLSLLLMIFGLIFIPFPMATPKKAIDTYLKYHDENHVKQYSVLSLDIYQYDPVGYRLVGEFTYYHELTRKNGINVYYFNLKKTYFGWVVESCGTGP